MSNKVESILGNDLKGNLFHVIRNNVRDPNRVHVIVDDVITLLEDTLHNRSNDHISFNKEEAELLEQAKKFSGKMAKALKERLNVESEGTFDNSMRIKVKCKKGEGAQVKEDIERFMCLPVDIEIIDEPTDVEDIPSGIEILKVGSPKHVTQLEGRLDALENRLEDVRSLIDSCFRKSENIVEKIGEIEEKLNKS